MEEKKLKEIVEKLVKDAVNNELDYSVILDEVGPNVEDCENVVNKLKEKGVIIPEIENFASEDFNDQQMEELLKNDASKSGEELAKELVRVLAIKPGDSKSSELKEFLTRIGNVPLLDLEKEQQYTLSVVEGKNAEEKLEKYNNGEISLTNEEINELYEKIEDKKFAREELTEHNQRLVVSIAKVFYPQSNMTLQDLVQEGVFGLLKAIDKFEPERGLKLSTYATPWIRQSISRSVAEKSRTIRIPVHVHERAITLSKASQKLHQVLGREATPEELSEETKIPLDKVLQTKRITKIPTKFETPAGDDETGATIGEMISDNKNDTPTQAFTNNEKEEYFKDLFNTILTPYQEKVITLKYGLFGINKHSLDEIAQIFDLPKSRIKAIEIKALKILKANDIKRLLTQVNEQ